MKRILLLIILCITANYMFSLDVDESEIKLNYDNIVFENYVGPHDKIDTVSQITAIGVRMGLGLEVEAPGEGKFYNKYRVLHLVDDSLEGMDADIFIIEAAGGVDHINNLRHMISGYLRQMYAYGKEDADLLAKFITLYNAVHRKDLDFFKERYTSLVAENLDASKAGLALSYKEWAGYTQIVIPIRNTAKSGKISSLDATELADDSVTENLREEDDKGLEDRKDIVDLQERAIDEQLEDIQDKEAELDQKEQQLQDDAKENQDQQQQVDEKIEDLEQKEDELTEQKQDLEDQNASQEDIEKVSEDLEDLRDEKQDLVEEKEDLVQEEKDIQEQQEQVQDDKQDLAEQKEDVKEQQQAVQDDRQDIAEDTASIIQEEQAKVQGQAFTSYNAASGRIVGKVSLVDPVSGDVIKDSNINGVLNRSLIEYGSGYLFLKMHSSGMAQLVIADPENLNLLVEGQAVISPDSVLVINKSMVYCVIQQEDSFRIGKFNDQLELELYSSAEVSEYTAIEILTKGILIESADGDFTLLSLTSME